jgi:DME family drug/metabolite transporter
MTALEISTWRILLVLPPLLVFLAVYRRRAFAIHLRDLPWYLIAGCGITIANITWAVSVQVNRPAAAAALSFSSPAFIALGERFIVGRRLPMVQVGAIAVNLLGCTLASGVNSPADLVHAPGGFLVGIANGVSFAAYTLLNYVMRPGRSRDPMMTLLLLFSFGEVGILVWGLPIEGARLFQLQLDLAGWALLVAVALFPTLAAYAFFNSSLRRLPATVATMVTTLEPPIVAVSALLLFGRAVQAKQWVGIAFIICAILTMQASSVRTAVSSD